jgi:alpha-mannosidase/mannosylglycerate hydrolase
VVADLPLLGSLVEVEGDLLLTALKRAEDREALVVRFLNEGSAAASAVVRPLVRVRRAYRVNLREEILSELDVAADGSVTVEAKPWELVTVALEF